MTDNNTFSDKTKPAPPQGKPTRQEKRTERAQTFRRNKGNETMNDYNNKVLARLQTSLFSEYEGLEDYIKPMTCTEKILAIDLYHTTRGIGLTQIEVTNRIEAQLPNEQIPTPSLYRTSLVQFEAKIEKTFVGRTEETQSVPGSDNVPRLSYDVVQAVESCSVNLAPISGLINSVGDVKVGNTKFRPARVDLVDPKYIRISNLRNYVMQAANPATPMPLRLRMFNLNSIPGAVWQNDLEIGPLLMNPDEIIPQVYGIDQMRHDFILVKACLGRISRKMPKYIGQVKFVREGNPGQLVSTVLDRDPPRCQMFNPGINLVVGDAEDFYVSRELAHSNVISGVLSLLGEVEIEAPAQICI